jgi:hypothetical protein
MIAARIAVHTILDLLEQLIFLPFTHHLPPRSSESLGGAVPTRFILVDAEVEHIRKQTGLVVSSISNTDEPLGEHLHRRESYRSVGVPC